MMKKELLDFIKEANKKDGKTDAERIIKLQEEMGELSQAFLSYSQASGCAYKGLTEADVCEEAIDVIIVALSVYVQHYKGKNKTEYFNNLVESKVSKWLRKVAEQDGKR